MKRFVLFACFFSMVQSVLAWDFVAEAPTGQDIYYHYVYGGVEVTYGVAYYTGCYTGNLTIPDSVVYCGLTYPVIRIGSRAFQGCYSLTSVTIPNSVTRIENYAFYGCSGLTSVTIPNSITYVGENAFRNCIGLTTVNFNAVNCSSVVGNVFFGDTNLSTINIGNSVTIIPAYLCYQNNWLSSITISNSVTSIGDYAFYNCSGLTSVTIPNSVITIGNQAFFGCSGLTSVTIGDSLTSIGNQAFYGCSGLTSVSIPNSVTAIGGGAFYGCNGLSSVTIPNSVDTIRSGAFSHCWGLTTVNFNADSCTYTGSNSVFEDCRNLLTINFGNSVTQIPSYLCSGLSRLSSVIIPNSVTAIGDQAFINCSGLASVAIGNSVTAIGSSAFECCYGLRAVTIPYSVISIGNDAFYHCTRLDTVWLLPNVPPSLSSSSNLFPSTVDCFLVSCDAYDAYYNALGWRGYRSLLQIYNWPNFVVNVSVNNSTYGTATIIQQSNHDVSCDSICTIRATSNYGYHFDHWNNGSTTNPDTFHIMGDSTIVAYFVPNQYRVVGISNYSDRGYVFGSDTVDYLDTVVLTAVANHGYMFDHWSDGAYENPHSVVASGNRTITAYFVPAQFSLSVISSDLNMGTVSGGGNYDYQSNRIIRAIANTGYHFTHWNDGDVNNNRTITLTQDTSFTAYFAPNQYTLTLQSADELLGIVTGGGEYAYHDTVTISATATAPHYHFDRWSDNNTENPRQYVITGDTTLTAYFELDVHSVVVQVDDLAHGTVSGGGNYAYGSAATITAETPFSGWVFSHWSDGATYNPYTFAVLQDTVMTAYFVREGSQNGVDGVDTISAKIYVNNGQIVVEGAEGYPVYLYDVVGRLLATRRETAQEVLLDVPVSGAYLVKIGDAPARRIVVRR